MGNRTDLLKIHTEIGPRPVRRGMGGHVEQYDTGCDKNTQTGHDGPEGLLGRGADYEEVAASETDSIVRRVYGRGADLYHH